MGFEVVHQGRAASIQLLRLSTLEYTWLQTFAIYSSHQGVNITSQAQFSFVEFST